MNKVKEGILHFKAEMNNLGVEVKSISFDKNTYDMLLRFSEKNNVCNLSCGNCPFLSSEIILFDIEIKKG